MQVKNYNYGMSKVLFKKLRFAAGVLVFMLGLVKGYMAEKQSADERMKLLENRNEALIKETERLRVRVRELEDNHDDVLQREQDLVHQQQTLELSVDDARKGMQV